MISKFDRFQKRRLISSYFSVVLSIFLMLFLLGVLGLFVINSKNLSDDFKEDITMTVFFKNEATTDSLQLFEAQLKSAKWVKDFKYVPKEVAAKEHQAVIGEDFMEFLGMNPLQNSFDIHLKANYVVNDSIEKIQSKLRENQMISDASYDKQLVTLVNNNIEKVSMWILIVSGVMALIAVLLINSALRLSIHSNRFIIKTMQMVGATKSFIRRPFIWKGILLGIIGAVFAVVALMGLLYYLDTTFPSLGILRDQIMTGAVLLGVLVTGIIVTAISTFIATTRFLNLRTDDLY
ncbi:cell division protein FtsX [Flavobacterium silvaticum]|uniref:Cell division protein FtsX n=1 Tax=Flavobacterium silvaticum TaxID=1852020 RepID=A0A972FNM5_9FLAO|nr:permease-like cell division protein FtsX [Flavobacterium silvaticum]NMH28570.1 ABC transporter permease [Flavobacterium silvaticum]